MGSIRLRRRDSTNAVGTPPATTPHSPFMRTPRRVVYVRLPRGGAAVPLAGRAGGVGCAMFWRIGKGRPITRAAACSTTPPSVGAVAGLVRGGGCEETGLRLPPARHRAAGRVGEPAAESGKRRLCWGRLGGTYVSVCFRMRKNYRPPRALPRTRPANARHCLKGH